MRKKPHYSRIPAAPRDEPAANDQNEDTPPKPKKRPPAKPVVKDTFHSIRQAARHFGISRSTLKSYCSNNAFPHYNIGSRTWFSHAELMQEFQCFRVSKK